MSEFGSSVRSPFRDALRALGLLGVGALAILAPASVSAQEISGEIVDNARRAVADVAIALFDVEGALVASTTSDERGSFSISAPEEGLYRMHLNRFGYRPLSGGPYALDSGLRLEVFVVMHPAPTEIDPVEVEVEGESPRLAIRGFYERREQGFGYFLDREDIERVSMSHLASVVGRLPRVRVDPRTGLFGTGAVRNPGLVYERGGTSCVPAFWLDGVLVRDGGSMADPLRIDDYVTQRDAEGIEFYGGPAGLPIEFAHSGACAVLVIWTRDSRGGSDPS